MTLLAGSDIETRSHEYYSQREIVRQYAEMNFLESKKQRRRSPFVPCPFSYLLRTKARIRSDKWRLVAKFQSSQGVVRPRWISRLHFFAHARTTARRNSEEITLIHSSSWEIY